MEKHLLHGVVNEHIERTDPDLIKGFAKHDVAKVGDAMGGQGIMHFGIKPLSSEMKILGSAVTVLTRPGDALFIQKVADVAQEGDIIVVDAGGNKDCAVIGERIGYYMKRVRGIGGIVVDGSVRDSLGLIEVGFSTFSRSVSPRLYGTEGPGAINVPIQCGGVSVNPGDLVLGDADGVVVVPREDAARVLQLSDEHLAGELERLDRVKHGEKLSVINNCDQKIDRWNK